MAKDAYSAISSWSGYVYQGKVAIFYALKIIRENIRTLQDFNIYELEVEWHEDFAIILNGQYISIHQVKAYKEYTSPSAYGDAIKDLYNKLSNSIQNGYLHIANNINFTDRTDSQDFDELKQNSVSSLHPIDNVTLDKIKLYSYCSSSNKEYCHINEIDNLILDEITNIYSIKDFGLLLTEKQKEYIRYKLFDLIDNHILEVHQGLRNKQEKINFSDILSFFAENNEEYSDEYKKNCIKNDLFNKIFEYCDDSHNCDLNQCNPNCHLAIIEKKLQTETADDIYRIVMRSTPHYEKFQDLMSSTGMKYSLIRGLHTINKNFYFETFLYKIKCFTLLPTLLAESRNLPTYAKNILSNCNLDNIVTQFEIDVFISDDIDCDDLIDSAKHLKSLSNITDFDSIFGEERKDAINKIKEIKIKSIPNVLEEYFDDVT